MGFILNNTMIKKKKNQYFDKEISFPHTGQKYRATIVPEDSDITQWVWLVSVLFVNSF